MLALELSLLHLLLNIHFLHSVFNLRLVLVFATRALSCILLLLICLPIASRLYPTLNRLLAFTTHIFHWAVVHTVVLMLVLWRDIECVRLILVILLHFLPVNQ